MNASPDTEPSAWRRHYTLLILLFVYAMSMIDRQIMAVLIEPVKKEFGVSDTAMGLLTGLAFALFYSVMAVPFARYADRTNRRNLVGWCCVAWSGATALCGLAMGYWQLAAARVAVAIGEAGGTAPSVSMIADSYPREQRSRAMSIFMLGPHLGMLFGLGLGAWIAQQYGWRAAFLTMAVPGVIAGLLLRYTAFEPPRGLHEAVSTKVGAVQESFSVMLKDLRASPTFVSILVAGSFLGFAGYAIGIWSTTFLVRSHGLSLRDAGTLMGLAGGTAAIIGALLSGWMADRLARHDSRWQLGVPALGTLLAVPFGLMFYMAPAGINWNVAGIQVPHAMPIYLCFSVLSVWWAAPAYAALTNIVRPDRRATAMALYNLVLTTIGGGLGPLSVGMLSDALTPRFGVEALRWSLVAMILIYLLAVLTYLLALKPYAKALSEVPSKA